jgi:hypothetical protein
MYAYYCGTENDGCIRIRYDVIPVRFRSDIKAIEENLAEHYNLNEYNPELISIINQAIKRWLYVEQFEIADINSIIRDCMMVMC